MLYLQLFWIVHLCIFPLQIPAASSPGKAAIPKKPQSKSGTVGVTRRNTFGYGDNKGPAIERTNKTQTPTPSSNNSDFRRWACCPSRKTSSPLCLNVIICQGVPAPCTSVHGLSLMSLGYLGLISFDGCLSLWRPQTMLWSHKSSTAFLVLVMDWSKCSHAWVVGIFWSSFEDRWMSKSLET